MDAEENYLAQFTVGKKEIYAARMAYFIPGFIVSTWGPMIPMVKERLGIQADVLGMLLLCVGVTAFIIMPMAGYLGQKFGCQKVVTVASILMAIDIVLLSFLPNVWLYAVFLGVLGAVMGTIDVNMNVNAVIVEKLANRRLMSGMHSFWSIGCFVAAGLFSLLAKMGISLMIITAIHCGIVLIILAMISPYILKYKGAKKSKLLALPKGIVILFGILACVTFLAEGAVMDWSGVFLTEVKDVELSLAGIGYAFFSVAMFVVRFIGDKIVQKLGEKKTVILGSILSGIGFLSIIFMEQLYTMLFGFICIGLGAANIVPVLYSLLKYQQDMPINGAVTAITSLGYTGVVLGPAILGFIAHGAGITSIFYLLGFVLILQSILAKSVLNKLN